MPELQELPIFDEGSRVFFIDHSDDVLETNIEEVKTIEDFITPDVLQGDMTINFVKEEVNVIDDLTSKEPLIIIDHEQFVDDVALVEDIESPLVQIVEHIEASEPNVAEDLNEILNKIIESPIEIKIQNSENIVAEIEVQEQLEEQLAEVLNRLGIEYTPDLIESLVERVLLVKKVQKLKYQEDIEKAPQDSGTHEPLLKLLIGSASSKNTIPHVYVLGRSALWLSSFSLAA